VPGSCKNRLKAEVRSTSVGVESGSSWTVTQSSSSSSTGFYNPLAGFSVVISKVSRSHTMTQRGR
jgi:hypothetical protein